MTALIPDSAPFTDEQKAWLNGFFAGLMGMQTALPSSASQTAGVMANLVSGRVADWIPGANPAAEANQTGAAPEDEEFPWHDAALPIVERMELSQGKPLARRLMAAMAQLDCASCGYDCKTYAEALAGGQESNTTLCSPGGKETKQMIKRLLAEPSPASGDGVPIDLEAKESNEPNKANEPNKSNEPNKTDTAPRYSRQNPFAATLLESRPLNQEGSAKDTRHVVLDLAGSGLTYRVGDALGVYPRNCPELVAAIVARLGTAPDDPITSPRGTVKSLADALGDDCCLKEPSDELLQLLADRAAGPAQSELAQIIKNGVPEGVDVLDVLQIAPEAKLTAGELIAVLEPLNPRLYSIASSMKATGDEVHLTLGTVTYERNGRLRKGVASTMLAHRIAPGQKVSVFVQPNHAGFTTPDVGSTPIIMVGPGTGIAPFRAFLQERSASAATGKNWLFFGDQRQDTDWLYEDELKKFQRDGVLTHLDTAFSRDGDRKVYVQDRMRQRGAELWEWINQGAWFYVCGDASRMASDVDRALKEIVATRGGMTNEQALAYVKQLAADGRYHRDVY